MNALLFAAIFSLIASATPAENTPGDSQIVTEEPSSKTTAAYSSGISKPLKPGDFAPDFTLNKVLNAPEGKVTQMKALRGQVVILEFWATWCTPCILAIPHWNELVDKFQDEPVEFISVTSEEKSIVSKFMAKRQIKGLVCQDQSDSLLRKYNRSCSIPTTVIIDKNGIIIGITTPDKITEKMILKVLAGKQAPLPIAPVTGLFQSDPQQQEPFWKLTLSESQSSNCISRFDVNSIQHPGITLEDLIALISNLPSASRVLGKDNLPGVKLEINARVPESCTGYLCPMVIQAIEGSYKIRLRKCEKELDVYVLTATDKIGPDLRITQYPDTGPYKKRSLTSSNATCCHLRSLAQTLENLLSRPVLDETGLEGDFDWDLEFESGNSESLLAAVQKQLGLKIVPTKRTIEVVVVESNSKQVSKAGG